MEINICKVLYGTHIKRLNLKQSEDCGSYSYRILQEFKSCMLEAESDETKQRECSFRAKNITTRNSESFQSEEWVRKNLEAANHGRYNGK